MLLGGPQAKFFGYRAQLAQLVNYVLNRRLQFLDIEVHLGNYMLLEAPQANFLKDSEHLVNNMLIISAAGEIF